MIEKKFINGSVSLNYVEGSDNGPPLLLLHGICSRWQSFLPLIPYLEEHFHIYALDLRGHGKSDRGSSYKIEDYVPDILSFIKDKIQDPTIICGHSFGGMVGILAAASNAELVKALIIGDSMLSLSSLKEFLSKYEDTILFFRELAKETSLEDTISGLKNRLIPVRNQKELVPAYKVLGENSPHFKFMAKTLLQLDSDILTANIESFEDTYRKYKTESLFLEIQCPVLLFQANQDLGGLMTDDEVKMALRLLIKAYHVKINNAGHFTLMMQDLEGVKKEILSFLSLI